MATRGSRIVHIQSFRVPAPYPSAAIQGVPDDRILNAEVAESEGGHG